MSVTRSIQSKVEVIEGCDPKHLPIELIQKQQPIIFKGLVKDWELTKQSQKSEQAAISYLKSLYNGRPTLVSIGQPEIKGRFAYNDEFTALNYETQRMQVDEVLDLIADTFGKDDAPHYYIPSNPTPTHFPEFLSQNELNVPLEPQFANSMSPPRPSLWIGNKTTASCHYDVQKNIACCTTGKRRFTLFGPDQIANLYPGPFDPTPGGPVISLVDFAHPDYEQFPKFKEALKHAQVAELEPGDALYIPMMWWHHVEGLADLNILVNFWWNETPQFMGPGINVLHHAILSLRDKSDAEKQAWKHIFDYYVFSSANKANQHIPEHAQGILAPLDDNAARRLRAQVINKLNR